MPEPMRTSSSWPAPLGLHLIFEVATCSPGSRHLLNGSGNHERASPAGIGIHEKRKRGCLGDATNLFTNFAQGRHSEIRQPKSGIGNARAREVNRPEAGILGKKRAVSVDRPCNLERAFNRHRRPEPGSGRGRRIRHEPTLLPFAERENYFDILTVIGDPYHHAMELRHLRYFIAVAEELNFRRAAERLNLTQPSLSAQVRALEQELDVRLLDRNTHQVSLTPAGHRFLADTRRLLRDAEESVRAARRVARGEAGELSIGFVASLGHRFLPKVLQQYRRRFPEVELRLTELDTTGQIEALNARRIDLGLIGFGLTVETSDLQIATVAEEQLAAVLPEGHPFSLKNGRKAESLPLSSLANENLILAARSSAPLYNPWLLVLCQQSGVQPKSIQEVGQPLTVLSYVAAGLGVSILPVQYRQIATAGVSFVPLAPPVPKYRYCAAWLPKNRHSALANFVETAKAVGKI
jgi:DNA-binding transcriptional LysR family regulator